MNAGERWLAFSEMLTIGALGLVGLCLALFAASLIVDAVNAIRRR
jgi:hypothetical protein